MATAFASVAHLRGDRGSAGIVFGVKAGFSEDGDETSREHLWIEVRRFEANRVMGELVNQPIAVTGLKKGEEIWVDREQVSDWRVMTPHGCFAPADITALWRSIDELKQGAATV